MSLCRVFLCPGSTNFRTRLKDSNLYWIWPPGELEHALSIMEYPLSEVSLYLIELTSRTCDWYSEESSTGMLLTYLSYNSSFKAIVFIY